MEKVDLLLGYRGLKTAKLAALVAGCLLSAMPVLAGSAYMTDSDGDFGTIDLSTGIFTPITTSAPSDIYGMGFAPNGVLYGTNSNSPATIYTIDPTTGTVANVGTAGYSAFGSTVGPDGLIYGISADANEAFYSVNPSTLATNTINSSLSFGTDGLAVFNGGEFYSDVYLSGSDRLVQIDPITGAQVPVGNGIGANILAGTLVGNTVYGIGLSDGLPVLETIDTRTGTGTLVADISGLGGDADPLSIAYLNTPANANAPEPETVLLMALPLAALVLVYRRKRAKSDSAEA